MTSRSFPALLLLMLSPVFMAQANGVLVSDATKGIYAKMLWSNVQVSVEGQVSMTTTTQQFINATSADMKVSFAFPMPLGATATRLRWREGSEWYQAVFVAQPQDSSLPGSGSTVHPNLASYLGKKPLYFGLPRAIKPDSLMTVELTYVELLPYKSGKVTYQYPNDYRLIQTAALQSQAFGFALSSQRTIESISMFSPLGGVSVNTGTHASVAWERNGAPADSLYVVSFSLRATELGLFAYSTKPSDTLGYFTFVVEPDPSATDVIKKNFAIIIDRSGSMSGAKMEQAKNAAQYVVNNLNPGDWYTLVDFDDVITPFRGGLVPYSAASRDSALAYVATLFARGGTNIAEAFRQTIPLFGAVPDTAANLIIFLTDGQATAGQTNTDSILAIVTRAVAATGRAVYVFTFGIGPDVNTQLLTLIASLNSGVAEFLGNDQVEARITDFYNTIRNPVLIGPKIAFSSPDVVEPYPNPLPNLYKGQQLLVSGAYTAATASTVTFSGTSFGHPVSYQYELALADTVVERYAFLPKLWAKLKIEFLLVRYYSAPTGSALAAEIKKEIIALSIRYGVVSPFTSFSGSGGGGTGVEERDAPPGGGIPHTYLLLGNYPNPFNAGTVIAFRVGKPLNHPTFVKIYTITGQLVRTLIVQVVRAGEYRIAWDATDGSGTAVPSGVYFYLIDLGDAVLGGRMLLIR